MYAPFFGLKQQPFSIAPDPRYLFMSERHREALAHLLYGVNGGGGFVLLSGEIGAGKTTVCRCFLEQIPRRCNVAYIFNPKLTAVELLKSVCEEFRIPYQHPAPGTATVTDYLDPLNEFLLKTHAVGQNNVLIIDEAQNLSADVLEQLRLLTNLETSERKLLQIILIGQPELRDMLARPELEQLAQRVIARFHLDALSETETAQYIRHRLAVAGLSTALPFDRTALRRIHRLSRGVPRRINLLCDRALLGAYADGKTTVTSGIVDKAASEVFALGSATRPPLAPAARAAAAAGLAVAAVLLLVGMVRWMPGGSAPSAQARPAAHALASVHASAPMATVATAATTAAPAVGSVLSSAVRATAPADAPALFRQPIRDEADAWRQLAPAWHVTLGAGEPCAAARQQQLLCFKGGGTLAMIRQLGRPGILTLRDEAGKPAYALLVGLTDKSVTLRMGTEVHALPLTALATLWHGDFATFWRVPEGYMATLTEGSSGPFVDRFASQIATAMGRPRPNLPQTVNSTLRAAVRDFQMVQGLVPDGIAGPTTFMQLNRATGVDEPRLQTES